MADVRFYILMTHGNDRYREDVYGELADVDAITAAIASFNPHYEFVPPSPAGSDGGDGPVNSDLADIEKARL